eukprot:403331645
MFTYRPTDYSPTASQRYLNQVALQQTNYYPSNNNLKTHRSIDPTPTLGGQGDPHVSAKPMYLLRQLKARGENNQSNNSALDQSSKFIRNSMEIDDINGTRSKRRVLTRNIGVGLGLIWQSQIEKDHFKDTIMLNKDIYETTLMIHTEMLHMLRKTMKKHYKIPLIQQMICIRTLKLLKSTLNSYSPFNQQNQLFTTKRRDPIYIDDIAGTKPNNVYRSTVMQSRREGSYRRGTNPLDPDYLYPGLQQYKTQPKNNGENYSQVDQKELVSFQEARMNQTKRNVQNQQQNNQDSHDDDDFNDRQPDQENQKISQNQNKPTDKVQQNNENLFSNYGMPQQKLPNPTNMQINYNQQDDQLDRTQFMSKKLKKNLANKILVTTLGLPHYPRRRSRHQVMMCFIRDID